MSIRNPPPPTYTSLALSSHNVKIYHTSKDNTTADWKYYGHQGVLVFGRESSLEQEYSFRVFVSNDDGDWSTLWMYKFNADNMTYHSEGAPGFHWFIGRTRKYGISFTDDEDAETFSRTVSEYTAPSLHTVDSRSTKQYSRRTLPKFGSLTSGSVFSLHLPSTPPNTRTTTEPSPPKRAGSRIWNAFKKKQ
ncbi:hypothetical protein CYLTODRAFT_427156 [Cylindrobasidium torrendii FP15055 ss-10]|uniref:WH1 domain-containing protein n=1 Tax=Cylindrobasidium torrendii FP15055 ss-10 TaxID=1314674 RepID=A0A0D7AXV5_9AGAR|nr:hypothetical protein CYLTODRAFT_427156 [Cylindrobasidium torrendii FP15055 ss-10]